MIVSDLAKEFGISTRTIRFYEERGIVSPERSGHTRIFSKQDRARLVLALRGKRLGFSLEEVKQYLELYDTDPADVAETRNKANKIDKYLIVLQKKQDDISKTIVELAQLKSQHYTHQE